MQTAKLASEVWLRSAPAQVVVANDHFVRSLVRSGLPPGGPGRDPDGLDAIAADPAVLREQYWQRVVRAKPVAVHFGAADHDDLDDYFTVAAERSTRATLERARTTISPGSPADLLLRSIDRLAAGKGSSPSEACRDAMRLLAAAWPELVERARPAPEAAPPAVASVLAEFHDALRAGHLGKGSAALRAGHLGEGSAAGRAGPHDGPFDARLTRVGVRELARLYLLARRCFTDEEVRLAQRLARHPRLRYALLATHLRLVAESSETAVRLAADWGTTRVLLPFTEAFVNRTGYASPVIDLAPNPKLITVLCNNVLPAVAGELIGRNADENALDAEVLAAGVQAAARRGVFAVTIGLFGETERRDVASLSGFSRRVCPAATPFAAFCRQWLPYYFDRCPGASARREPSRPDAPETSISRASRPCRTC
ncbi:hypothetical protein FXF53_06585 [Micromonospora sp. WP24]|uniref:hypothetical protein n=1 Tax=Micromonospora sp. WP24 TaxID=2604469 RepID=UPI0011D3A3B9|nr:hypothetical protein [Micromonospora sp. WP24]TYC04779.1 hypothetical protein FXF53_06585 [Micromonospora sp. WP24]